MFNIKRGDQFTTMIFLKSSDGTPVNITGCTIFFIVRTTSKPDSITDDDQTVKIKKTITSHSDALNGKTAIFLTSSDTDFSPGGYYREIQVKFQNGDIYSASTGELKISHDLNKRTS